MQTSYSVEGSRSPRVYSLRLPSTGTVCTLPSLFVCREMVKPRMDDQIEESTVQVSLRLSEVWLVMRSTIGYWKKSGSVVGWTVTHGASVTEPHPKSDSLSSDRSLPLEQFHLIVERLCASRGWIFW